MAFSNSSSLISGLPSGCPATPTSLKLYLSKYSVCKTSKLLEIFPFCFPPPPITNIFLHPLSSDKFAIYFSKSDILSIVLDGR